MLNVENRGSNLVEKYPVLKHVIFYSVNDYMLNIANGLP